MPIRPEDRAKYPSDWKQISRRIRTRARDRCERCGAPNHTQIARGVGEHEGTYSLGDGSVYDAETGKALGTVFTGCCTEGWRPVRVVLTVAHLNHDPSDCRDENLQALCQRCHLRLDRAQHLASARATRRRRLREAGQLELLPETEP